jgi:hypothetical protein
MFHKSLNGKYKNGPFFYRQKPKEFSMDAADLVTRMLGRDPVKRLKLEKHVAEPIKGLSFSM